MRTTLLKSALCAATVLGTAGAHAQPAAGEVTLVQGVTSAQRAGQDARFLTKGDTVGQGDVISTGGRGFAVIALKDGTKMTLRPNTTFALDKFAHDAGEENLAMRLLRGGLRAVTGLIGKRNPTGVQMGAATATIGIRGTEFDVRLCRADCRQEAQFAGSVVPTSPPQPVVARVAELNGSATAMARDGRTARAITRGAAVYDGESVRTSRDSYALLAFRDQSKVTLTAETEFKLENVRFDPGQVDQGNFAVRLVRGGLRMLTGLVGRRDPRSVQINAATATIGIRGTGVDVYQRAHCFEASGTSAAAAPTPPPATPATDGKRRGRRSAPAAAAPSAQSAPRQVCSEDSVHAYTWDGAVGLEGGGTELRIEKDRAGVFNPRRGTPELHSAVPAFFLEQTAPRPDQVEVNFDDLFAVQRLEEVPPGLYAGVREGHISMLAGGRVIDLGPWEAGVLIEGADKPARIEPLPGFLFNDRYPTPDRADEGSIRLIELLSPGGESEGGICEMN